MSGGVFTFADAGEAEESATRKASKNTFFPPPSPVKLGRALYLQRYLNLNLLDLFLVLCFRMSEMMAYACTAEASKNDRCC